MRIADALKAVARIGSPRLVAYGELMFGRMTILVRQYSRRQVGREHRVPPALVRTVADGPLECGCAPRQTPLVGTSQAGPRLAPAVLTPG